MPSDPASSDATRPSRDQAAGSAPPEQLTPQQTAAIRTRHVSIALSAGAGCGKTFVLTRRFVSHLEPGPHAEDLSRLVAITFTERAAREMRERVRQECRRRLERCPESDVEHWLSLVRQLDTARITTIHSFCGSLLRSFAIEAGLDPRFKLLDEAESGSLLRLAVRDSLHRLLASGNEDAFELVYEFGLERTLSHVELLTPQRYRLETDQWRNLAPRELADQWEQAWYRSARPQLLREFLESPATARVRRLLQEHVPNHPGMRERCQSILEDLPLPASGDDPLPVLERLRQNARVTGGGGAKAWSREDVYEEVKKAFETFRKAIVGTREGYDYVPDDLENAAACGLRLARVVEQAGAEYDARKRAGGWLDFDDLLLGARDLLRDWPEALERAAAGLSLLLVDEFQDTDPVQTEIVRRLCGPALLQGKLFVVGDVKQSIYRFRRAEPRVFRELREEIPEAGRLPLTRNFRSQPAILNFVNALFDGVLGDEYEPLEPSCPQLSAPPSIEFLFSSPPDAPDSELDEADSAVADAPVADLRRLEADWIARRLRQLLDDGVPRVRVRDAASGADRLRTLQLRDVVILFRAMTDVRYYEEALRRQGLDYYVIGGQAFYAQQEVFDLVNLCRVLGDPDDEVALLGVLRSPFFALSDDALLALARAATDAAGGRRRSLLESLSPPPRDVDEVQAGQMRFAGQILTELRSVRDRLPLASLLTRAVEATGYDATLLTEFLGARKLANLRKLIEMARQFDETGLFTLADFVDRLQECVGEETKEALAATHPESSNVIRLMSIHQSKGLEFPLVVLADMDRPLNNQPPAARFDAQLGPLVAIPPKFEQKRENLGLRLLSLCDRRENLEELSRLLYVALTRAADHLILSASLKSPGKPKQPWLRLVAERFDLLTGQPRLAPACDGASPLARHSGTLPEIRVHHGPPDPAPAASPGAARGLPLHALRAALDAAEPASLSVLLAPVPPGARAFQKISVSAIRQADADERGRTPLSLDLADDLPAQELAEEPEISPSGGGATDARHLGDIVHAVLERIDLARPADAPRLVQEATRLFARRTDEATRAAATACVTAFLASPVAAELAAARPLLREIEFFLPWPPGEAGQDHPPMTRVIAGKLDVLLRSPAGAWSIIDYKTGGLHPGQTLADVLAGYEMQLALYALAARHGTGDWPARTELVLLRQGAARVPFDPRAADWPLLTARINAAMARIAP